MGKEKPLEQGTTKDPSFSSHAADWLNAFKKHFSIAFQDAASNLPSDVDDAELQKTAIAAMTNTLRDSGLSEDQMLVFLEEALRNVRSEAIEWTPKLNQRRIDLIDRDIAHSISFDEKVELAQLTNALRACVNTEENFPLEGARELHAKLKMMEQKEDRN